MSRGSNVVRTDRIGITGTNVAGVISGQSFRLESNAGDARYPRCFEMKSPIYAVKNAGLESGFAAGGPES